MERTLDRLVQRLREAGGNNLLGIALYGGLVKGRHTPGVSDVNVLVVLADARLSSLLPLAPALTAALRQAQVVPFIATPADLREAAHLFPVRILDIQDHHQLLHGDVHLSGLIIDRASLELRILQSLKNIELYLRQRALERGGDVEALWQGLASSLLRFSVTLETVVRMSGQTPPEDRAELMRLVSETLALAPERLARLAALRPGGERPSDEMVRDLLDDLLTLLAELPAKIAAATQRGA